MKTDRRSQLVEAMENESIVKFWNPYDQGSTNGFVLDVGPRFFLLSLIDGNIKFNGFQCFRIADLRRLQVVAEQSDFLRSALRKRKQKLMPNPGIDVCSLPALLQTANSSFPLVTIHREKISPDTCKIGKLLQVNHSEAILVEVTPDAVWETGFTKIRLSDITRVEFGGGYEEALYLVGGKIKSSLLKSLCERL